MLKLLPFAALVSLAACVETTTSAEQTMTDAPQQTAFLGNWKTVQTCGDNTQTNILKIKTATPNQVLGSTNVRQASGKIIGGTVSGRNITFTNTYIATWDKHQKYTEVWTGKMSADGMSVSGKYSTNNPDNPVTCTFAGPRI